MLGKLWTDHSGGVITSELVLVASVTVGILLAGLATLRNGLLSEFTAVEKAIQSQSIAVTAEPTTAPITRSSSHLQLFVPDQSPRDPDNRKSIKRLPR